jgi:hypothetical protein
MQIYYVKISCKEDVHICHTNFTKQMERNLHETTSRWKTYRKRLFSEYLEVQDASHYPWVNSTSNLLLSLARVGRTSGIYTIRHSGMSNLEASLGVILIPSMHWMESTFCNSWNSSSLSFKIASSYSSSLTSVGTC